MKEAYSHLVRRLDDMGRDLNTAIAHIMGALQYITEPGWLSTSKHWRLGGLLSESGR